MQRQMIATRKFPYAGRMLKVDEPFVASERDAVLLEGIGKARPVDGQPKSKRRYKRRDMQAEE
jgi:hypothetical protein